MKDFRIHPLGEDDTRLALIVKLYDLGAVTKQEAKKAINKLRMAKLIEENMYQGGAYE